MKREELIEALDKPLPTNADDLGDDEFFDPWQDIIKGIHGSYASECDELMIETLEAVRDGTTFDLIEKRGFVVEFMLYVLSGHQLTDYGTSPRGAWPTHRDLWQPLIDKWTGYSKVHWSED